MARGRFRAVVLVEVEYDDPNVQHPENDEDLARSVCGHLAETFNGDGSLARLAYLPPQLPDLHADVWRWTHDVAAAGDA